MARGSRAKQRPRGNIAKKKKWCSCYVVLTLICVRHVGLLASSPTLRLAQGIRPERNTIGRSCQSFLNHPRPKRATRALLGPARPKTRPSSPKCRLDWGKPCSSAIASALCPRQYPAGDGSACRRLCAKLKPA
ncbi:uncharacterized protein VTP21DRAFT_9664 [Calcarisporiella thermophila]|uniref:uncharacterized protein n=1 Tax=Calcarisporiella thermophila TaxID=911321 RepID=UPI0037442E8F